MPVGLVWLGAVAAEIRTETLLTALHALICGCVFYFELHLMGLFFFNCFLNVKKKLIDSGFTEDFLF